jgi:DNA adenine methylase
VKPFLKWAGGKRQLVDRLLPLIPAPKQHGTYFEPFLGGGAIYFARPSKPAVLSDSNLELMDVYRAVRDNVDSVIKSLRNLKFGEDEYYRVRSSRPRESHTRAARFIYLNKSCFNGLYRVNLKGRFNVPFGSHPGNHVVCDVDQLRRASEALQGAELKTKDFEEVVTCAKVGDTVYFDPPYTTSHSNNGFIEYNARVFTWADQFRLAQLSLSLVKRGVNVAVSNAEHESIRSLYESPLFDIHLLTRSSTMASSPKKRRMTSELLIVGSAVPSKRDKQ